MRIHIDGDVLKYRCGFAAERGEYQLAIPLDNGEHQFEVFQYKKDLMSFLKENKLTEDDVDIEFVRNLEPVENALSNVKTVIEAVKERMMSNDVVVYLSGETNFRNDVAVTKPYKGNRDEAHKPVHGDAIVDYMIHKYGAIVSYNEEADDVIGYSHYAMWLEDIDSTCICTTDKDLNMIPGHHYDFVKDEMYYVTREEADQQFILQVLTGDATDNIPGCPGIGKVKAAKLIPSGTSETEAWEIVQDAYIAAMDDDVDRGLEYLKEQATLLWIRRQPGDKFEVWK